MGLSENAFGTLTADRTFHMMPVAKIAAAVLLADFVSGLVHWLEDTFWTENSPVVGHWLVVPNSRHHRDGLAFTKLTWLESSWDLALAGLVIFAITSFMYGSSWSVALFVIVGANANQIHKWNHMARGDVPRWVKILQSIYILQSPAHHAGHHRGDRNTRYCIVTDVLNPLLDRSRFWRVLEAAAVPLFGAPRRFDIPISRRLGFIARRTGSNDPFHTH
jgi:plasmanylethanolamine desaturase